MSNNEQQEHPLGDLTLAQIDDMAFGYCPSGKIGELRELCRAIEHAAIAAYLARQPKAEQPVIKTWQERRDDDIEFNGEASPDRFVYAAEEIADLRAALAAGAASGGANIEGLQRYDFDWNYGDPGIFEEPDGEYVKFSDVQAILAAQNAEAIRNAALTEALDAAEAVMKAADDASESAEGIGAFRCVNAIRALQSGTATKTGEAE